MLRPCGKKDFLKTNKEKKNPNQKILIIKEKD